MKLAIDCGGSEIRIGSTLMQDVYPAPYKIVRSDYIPPEVKNYEVADVASINFNVKIAKGSSANFFNTPIQEQRNDSTKTETITTYVNIIYSIGRFIAERVSREEQVHEIELYLALPPREVYSNLREVMKSKLKGEYIVTFNDDTKIEFIIKEVAIVAEGMAAFAYIEEDLSSINVMIVDSGYRSTEICIVRDYEPVNGALETFGIGGINLEANLEKALTSLGRPLGKVEIRECLADGVTQRAIKVGPVVKKVKEDFAEEIYRKMNEVSTMSEVPLSSIQYVVFVGRVFNYTGNKNDASTDGGSIMDMIADKVHATVLSASNIDGLCSYL